MNQSDYNDLRLKVSKLLEEPLQPADFIRWLGTYAARGKELLNGHAEEPQVATRDILASLARFQSDQKVVDWSVSHKITLGQGVFWWWLNPDDKVATINGLDKTIRGIPRITNGIDVWLELPDGTCFKGHRDWLKYDRRKASIGQPKASSPTVARVQAKHVEVAEKIVASGSLALLKERYEAVCQKPLVCKLEVKEVSQAVAEYLEKMTAL